jgi:hypothetical protein
MMNEQDNNHKGERTMKMVMKEEMLDLVECFGNKTIAEVRAFLDELEQKHPNGRIAFDVEDEEAYPTVWYTVKAELPVLANK